MKGIKFISYFCIILLILSLAVIAEGEEGSGEGESSEEITVVLADIKTGKAQLNRTERKIKEAVEQGRVRWETIRIDF